MPLGTEVDLGPGNVVLDGVAAPPKRGTAPQFSVHVYYGETAGWMKIEDTTYTHRHNIDATQPLYSHYKANLS